MHSLSTAVTSSLIVKSTQAPNSLQACNARREQWRHRASGAELRSEQPQTDGCTPQSQLTRRQQLAALGPLLLPSFPTYGAAAAAATDDGRPLPSDSRSLPSAGPLSTPDFTREGPFQPIKLPQLEHTCTSCDAPADRCRLKIHAWVPKGGGRVGLTPPYPLAVITPGFLLSSDQYTSYAHRLASWGWVAVTYDRVQQALDPVSDVVCVSFLRDLLDWCRTSVPLGTLCDPSATFLIGHSRGAKISTLAATKDPRVQALFLLDPVDVTVYAPLSVEYPSAVTALSGVAATGRSLPVAIVGSGRGGDCVPKDSNYARFYDAAAAPAWEGVVEDAGHLQFLDARGGNAMDLVCAAGKVPDAAVAELAKAMMVAWGEAMVRGDNGSINRASSDSNGRTGGGHGASDDARGRLRLGVDRDGNLVAGMAPFNALQLLYATEAAARKAIKSRQEHELQLATRAKNFEL